MAIAVVVETLRAGREWRGRGRRVEAVEEQALVANCVGRVGVEVLSRYQFAVGRASGESS